MNWKSTAFVSGAGLLATWLANLPAPQTSRERVAPAVPAAVRADAASTTADVAHLAAELNRRTQAIAAYTPPARNPFRFTPPPAPARARVAAPVLAEAPSVASTPLLRFSGVATDRVGDKEIWTAILSTPSGLVFVREGEQVEGLTVLAIGAERVALARPDGTELTLPLSGR